MYKKCHTVSLVLDNPPGSNPFYPRSMSPDLNHYRGTGKVFNNRNFIMTRDNYLYLCKLSLNFLITFMGFFLIKLFVTLLLLFTTSFVFSLTTLQMVRYFQKSCCKGL